MGNLVSREGMGHFVRDVAREVPVLAGSCTQEGDSRLLHSWASADDLQKLLERWVATLTRARWPPRAVTEATHSGATLAGGPFVRDEVASWRRDCFISPLAAPFEGFGA